MVNSSIRHINVVAEHEENLPVPEDDPVSSMHGRLLKKSHQLLLLREVPNWHYISQKHISVLISVING